MTTTAFILLATTAVVGTILWYVVDRRRTEISVTAAVLAAAGPTLLLGGAGLFALGGTPATGALLGMTIAAGVIAAIPGGGLLATAVLRVADRKASAGRKASADDEPPAAPPPPPAAPAEPLPAPLVSMTSPLRPMPEAPQPPPPQTFSDPQTLRGGATIGALERVAIVVTLLAGWPEGVALTLAIKGFGRYSELRKPDAPERFIIGTFASLLWAVAVTGVIVALRS